MNRRAIRNETSLLNLCAQIVIFCSLCAGCASHHQQTPTMHHSKTTSFEVCEREAEFAFHDALQRRQAAVDAQLNPRDTIANKTVRDAPQDMMVVAKTVEDLYGVLTDATKQNIRHIIDETPLAVNFFTNAAIYQIYIEKSCQARVAGASIRPLHEINRSHFFHCLENRAPLGRLERCMQLFLDGVEE